jgi:hypothetical protein
LWYDIAYQMMFFLSALEIAQFFWPPGID